MDPFKKNKKTMADIKTECERVRGHARVRVCVCVRGHARVGVCVCEGESKRERDENFDTEESVVCNSLSIN